MKHTLTAVIGFASLGLLAIPAQADSLNISFTLGDPGYYVPIEPVHYAPPPPSVIVVHHEEPRPDYYHDHGHHYGHYRHWHEDHHARYEHNDDYREYRYGHGGDDRLYRSEARVYDPAPVIKRVDVNPKFYR